MKKIFTLLTAVAISMTAMATTFTFSSADDVNQKKDGYSVLIAKGSGNNAPAGYSNGLRLYAGNTITVSGTDLTNIKLTFAKQGSKDYSTLSASTGSLKSGGESTSGDDLVTDVWTGTANSVTFTLGDTGQRLIDRLIVNGDGSEDTGGSGSDNPSNPSTPDTPGELDPGFNYPEPTMLLVPAKTVQGEAYSFISNNVLVSCTKGAITDTYFSAHAGFEMTFTATKPIKGIVVNGMVKKDFTASVNHGDVVYLSPTEDTEGAPAVVITDIDSKSVTISCVKQLRCYNVEVYFNENPDDTVSEGTPGGGGTGGGSGLNLTFDSAEAVYESELVEEYGEENYSIYLFNEASPDVPYFALDIYPESKNDLTGTYTWDDYTLGDYCYYVYGEGDEDFTWVDDGTVTITKKGDIYSISGTLLCDNGNTYTISFTGEMPIYLDDDYYYDDDTNGVGELKTEAADYETPAYDINGHKVNAGYRGIIIRNGKKYINR